MHLSHSQNSTTHTASWIRPHHDEHMTGGPSWQWRSTGYHCICARLLLHNIPSQLAATLAAVAAAFVGVAVGIVDVDVVVGLDAVEPVFLVIAVMVGSAAALVVR